MSCTQNSKGRNRDWNRESRRNRLHNSVHCSINFTGKNVMATTGMDCTWRLWVSLSAPPFTCITQLHSDKSSHISTRFRWSLTIQTENHGGCSQSCSPYFPSIITYSYYEKVYDLHNITSILSNQTFLEQGKFVTGFFVKHRWLLTKIMASIRDKWLITLKLFQMLLSFFESLISLKTLKQMLTPSHLKHHEFLLHCHENFLTPCSNVDLIKQTSY